MMQNHKIQYLVETSRRRKSRTKIDLTFSRRIHNNIQRCSRSDSHRLHLEIFSSLNMSHNRDNLHFQSDIRNVMAVLIDVVENVSRSKTDSNILILTIF